MGKNGYGNKVLTKKGKKIDRDKEIVKELESKVAKWLFPFFDKKSIYNSIKGPSVITDGNNEEISEEFLVFKLFTDDNEYTFAIKIDFDNEEHFLEAFVRPRKPNPGEKASKVKILPNGDFSDELWSQLKDCVLKNELLDGVGSDWKN